jgi:hypothetical protein
MDGPRLMRACQRSQRVRCVWRWVQQTGPQLVPSCPAPSRLVVCQHHSGYQTTRSQLPVKFRVGRADPVCIQEITKVESPPAAVRNLEALDCEPASTAGKDL